MDIRHVESPRKRRKVSTQQTEVTSNVLSDVTNRNAVGDHHEQKSFANEKSIERGSYDHRKRHSWRARQATLLRLKNFLGGSRGSPASSPEHDVKRSDLTDQDACSRRSEDSFTRVPLARETDGQAPFSPQNYCTSAEQEAKQHADKLASPGQQCQPVTPSPLGSNDGSLLRRCNNQTPQGNDILSPRNEKVWARDCSGATVKHADAEFVGWQAAGHLKPLPSALLSPPLPMTTPSPCEMKPPRHPSLTHTPRHLISSILPATKKVAVKAEGSPRVRVVNCLQGQQQGNVEKGQEVRVCTRAAVACTIVSNDGLGDHDDDGDDDDGRTHWDAQERRPMASLNANGSLHMQVKTEEALGVPEDPITTLLTCPPSPKFDNMRFVEAFALAAGEATGTSKGGGCSGGRQGGATAAPSAAPGGGAGVLGSLPHLQRLNPEQVAAATASPDRPLLVLAGPGSGKVRGGSCVLRVDVSQPECRRCMHVFVTMSP